MKRDKKIRKTFLRSLKAGTGKAHLLQVENPKVDFSKEILKGATKNYAYDPQCEGSRARYIYRLISNSPKAKALQKAILKKLLAKNDNWYALDQMLDLAVLFYQNGNLKAKKVIEKRFQKNADSGAEFVGEQQLITINGLEGLLQVAELTGRRLMEDKEDYETSWLVDRFQKRNKKIDVYAVLKSAAKRNVYVRKYLNSILMHKIVPYKKRKTKRLNYKEVKQKIERNRLMVMTKAKAGELTQKEVKQLARDFLREKNDKRKEKYLRFFSARKYPNDIQPILAIIKSPNPPQTRLVEFAAESLKYFKAKKIRRSALKKIKSTKNPADYLPLLASNYQEGDGQLLLKVLDRSKKQDFVHSLVYGFITIYSFNKTKECKAPLLKMYESMNCGIHRNDLLRIMHENGVLDKSVLRELQYDSYSENRKLFKKIRKGK